MIAASKPARDARLLIVRADGQLEHRQRASAVELLREGDLVIANDAATIPASLRGTHLRSGTDIEVRLARRRSFPSDMRLWFTERDRIYRTIMKEAWNDGKRAFTQFPGSDAVDASVLLMPLMKFIAPHDPRMTLTLDAIFRDLLSDTQVQRYEIGRAATDGLPGFEGTFSVCSFWLVEAIARAGRLEQAQLLFEKMLTYANPLGLFSEEIGPAGESLGNFPQAFTHLGLISAAVNLNDLLDGVFASPAGGWFGGRGGHDGEDQ